MGSIRCLCQIVILFSLGRQIDMRLSLCLLKEFFLQGVPLLALESECRKISAFLLFLLLSQVVLLFHAEEWSVSERLVRQEVSSRFLGKAQKQIHLATVESHFLPQLDL